MNSVRLGRLMTAFIILLVVAIGTQAQENNLLENPGFEDGFRQVDPNRSVALSWEPWNAQRSVGMPTFQNAQPDYFASTEANARGAIPRPRSAADAQVYFSFFETHDAGIYQTIDDVEPGTELRFSIYGYVLSTRLSDLTRSENPGGVALRVGIDPTGGIDPFSDEVVYSEAAIFYDAYRQYSVIATAESDSVTVFVRTTVSEPVQFTYVYLDDAVLEITPESLDDAETTEVAQEPTDEPQPATDEPTVTSTATPTDTPQPTTSPDDTGQVEDPTPTAEGPDDEDPTPTAEGPDDEDPTNTPTDTSEPTATNTAEPTATDLPTETAEPTATMTATTTPSATPTSTNTPSATPMDADPTPTPEGPDDGTDDASDDSEDVTVPISEEFPGQVTHTVQRGDTVIELARLYGSSTQAIIEANGIDPDSALIFIGQNLIIPVRLVPATNTPTPTPLATSTPLPDATLTPTEEPTAGSNIYIVRPGDTLSSIASRFNTTTTTLVQLNGITNPNIILIGQAITLPVGTNVQPTPTATPVQLLATPTQLPNSDQSIDLTTVDTYVVQPGDTLFQLALRLNVGLVALAEANNITNYNLILIGQRLTVPRDE